MPIVTQPAFTAGELAPAVQARIDLAKYGSGVNIMKNFFCHAQGGASNRPGSYYIAEVKDSAKTQRLIPFVFSASQAYALEFGDNTLRFVTETSGVFGLVYNALVESGVVKWTASGSGTNEYYMELAAGGDPGIMEVFSVLENSVAMANGTMGSLTAGQWDYGDNDALGYSTPYVRLTDNADPDSKADEYLITYLELATTYGEDDLVNIKYTQSADVMYFTCPGYYPQKLSRVSNSFWTIEDAPIVDGPYRSKETSDEDIILTPAARQGDNIAVSANAAFFDSKHVGSPVRFGYSNPVDVEDIQWGYGIIDQVTNSTTARMDIAKNLGYEMLVNPEFKLALTGWRDNSSGVSALTFDATNFRAVLTTGASGRADMRQTFEHEKYTSFSLSMKIETLTGASPAIRMLVGTTDGGSNLTGVLNYTTTGVKTVTFQTTTGEESFLTVDTLGSTSGDVCEVSEVSITGGELATPDFRIGAWNGTDGYPQAVGVNEQRLCFGGSAKYPITSWLSKTGKFEDFGFHSPIEDADAFTFRFDSGEVNDIQWIASLGSMIVGTAGAEWRVRAGSNADALSPSSIDAKAQSYNGCASIEPLTIGSTTLFIQRGANVVRDLRYSLEADGYAGKELSIMSNHLFKRKTLLEWSYGRLPYSIIWGVRSDGVLLGFTYVREQEVWGWHRHETLGSYKSVCAVPGTTEDRVYVIVQRTIDGNTKQFIEVFKPRIADEDTYDYFFVDCGLTYDGSPATSISGLDHLEGEDVAVLADGAVVSGLTVASGAITLPFAASLVHVGLPYTSDLELLGVQVADEIGSSEGRTKSIPIVNIKFEDSRACWAGPDEDHLDEMRFREDGYGDDPIPLATETKPLTFDSGYDINGRVFIRNTDPVPVTILSITPDVELSER